MAGDVNTKVDGQTVLFRAACVGNSELVSYIISLGAELNTTSDVTNDFSGWTPLMIAACHGHVDVVRLLLEAGADKEVKDSEGCTIYDIVTFAEKKEEILEVFRTHDIIRRQEVVAMSGILLTLEMQEICGDFIHMTPARYILEKRLKYPMWRF